MSETKPSSNPIISPSEGQLALEVAEVDPRGRFHILNRWAALVGWSLQKNRAVDALLILEVPGRLSIQAWEPDGPRILASFKEEKDRDADTQVLLSYLDRYQRLAIGADRRPYLGDLALVHLGIPIRSSEHTAVYAAISPGRIDLMSQAFRNEHLVRPVGAELP